MFCDVPNLNLILLTCCRHIEPIITLVDGLLEGDHCVGDCLAKGNFGELRRGFMVWEGGLLRV